MYCSISYILIRTFKKCMENVRCLTVTSFSVTNSMYTVTSDLHISMFVMYMLCRPSLGAQMGKVFAAGGIYGVFAFLDGITRSYSVSLYVHMYVIGLK